VDLYYLELLARPVSVVRLEEDKTPGSLGFTKVKLLPDGVAHFTRGVGFSCLWWDSECGLGERSWRYSMVIDDMKTEKVFVEKPLTLDAA
jgi:peroxiredoxin